MANFVVPGCRVPKARRVIGRSDSVRSLKRGKDKVHCIIITTGKLVPLEPRLRAVSYRKLGAGQKSCSHPGVVEVKPNRYSGYGQAREVCGNRKEARPCWSVH